jgi:LppM domain
MRARAAARVIGALAVAMGLTGCVKLDVDLTVTSDDTTNGTLILAVETRVLEAAGQTPEGLYDTLAANVPNDAGIKPEPYDEDGFAGIELTLQDVPLAAVPHLGPIGSFRFTRDGDQYQFDAVLNLGSDVTSSISVPEGLTSDADLRVAITFPGEVTATNGQKDGRTARWTPALGQSNELTATALATGGATGDGDDSTNGWLVLVAVIGGLAVVGVAAALFLTRRRELARTVPLTPLPSDTEPPPPLSSLNRPEPPERPLPRPLPPPKPPT